MAAPIKHGVVPKRALAIWSSRDVREDGQWGSNALGLELVAGATNSRNGVLLQLASTCIDVRHGCPFGLARLPFVTCFCISSGIQALLRALRRLKSVLFMHH